MCSCPITKADSTLSASQPVPQASTRRALHRLTSEVERDPVHSVRYGRQRVYEAIDFLLRNRSSFGFRTRNSITVALRQRSEEHSWAVMILQPWSCTWKPLCQRRHHKMLPVEEQPQQRMLLKKRNPNRGISVDSCGKRTFLTGCTSVN